MIYFLCVCVARLCDSTAPTGVRGGLGLTGYHAETDESPERCARENNPCVHRNPRQRVTRAPAPEQKNKNTSRALRPFTNFNFCITSRFADAPISLAPRICSRASSLSLSLISLSVILLLRVKDPYRWKLLATLPRCVVVRVFCARRCCLISIHDYIRHFFCYHLPCLFPPFIVFLIGYGITCVAQVRFRDAQPKKKRTRITDPTRF